MKRTIKTAARERSQENRQGARRPARPDPELDEALDDSFPASDPPSMTNPTRGVGAGPGEGRGMPRVIHLAAKLDSFAEHWSPKIVENFNGHDVMVVKLKGKFVWHSHPDTDDLFLVLKGHLVIRFRDGEAKLGPGDLCVVPKGMEHRPVAEEEVHLLLIEPRGTPNAGDPATAAIKERI